MLHTKFELNQSENHGKIGNGLGAQDFPHHPPGYVLVVFTRPASPSQSAGRPAQLLSNWSGVGEGGWGGCLLGVWG